jgi:hypothetical protein
MSFVAWKMLTAPCFTSKSVLVEKSSTSHANAMGSHQGGAALVVSATVVRIGEVS